MAEAPRQGPGPKLRPWPPKADLERWMMNTVKARRPRKDTSEAHLRQDPDPGAVFLRQVLQPVSTMRFGTFLQRLAISRMNPAYGSYMQTDKESNCAVRI